MAKQREVVLGPSITLPAMNTLVGEQTMSALEFLEGWVLTSPTIKETENLPHLFELEEALAKVKAEALEKSGSKLPTNIVQPTPPGPNATTEEAEQYKAKLQAVVEAAQQIAREHWRAVYDASVGMTFTISDDAFQVSVSSIKSYLDQQSQPNQMTGRPNIDPFIERKVLRLFHAYSQSKEISG